MRGTIYIFVLVIASCISVHVRADDQVSQVSLCDLYQHPEQYAGKTVKVRGSVTGNDIWIDAFTQEPCPASMKVIVVFPNEVKPKPTFDLMHDDSFKEFERALYGPTPSHIEATFEGRFDSVVSVQDGKRIRTGKGFGKHADYDGRIVLHEISDVMARPLPRK